MPDNPIKPDEKGHQNIRIFQGIYATSLECSKAFEEDINETKKSEQDPNSRKYILRKLDKFTSHKPDVVASIEMCPPIEHGNSGYHPAHGLVHDSVNRFSVLFF